MRILIVEPGKRPRVADIPHTLKAMQSVVGGLISTVYPWADPVALVCDDEGLLKDYELNRQVSKDVIIAGTFFICGLAEDDFADLPDEYMEKYERKFRYPEIFVRTVEGVMAIPLKADGEEMEFYRK